MDNELDDIIKGCKSGKLRSQEQLFKLFSKKLFGVCMLYTKDRSSAEDILQDSFVKIFQHIKQYEGRGVFEGWLRRIVVNTALERFRREVHLYPVAEVREVREEFSYDDIVSQISSQELMALIQELSPQYKMVFCLYGIEGYSHKEIAEKLGINEGTSKSNLSRARDILQAKVEVHYHETKKRKVKP